LRNNANQVFFALKLSTGIGHRREPVDATHLRCQILRAQEITPQR